MKNKVWKIIALGLDIVIAGLVIFSAISMFTSPEAKEVPLAELLKYYTVESNFFMGAIALVYIPFDIFIMLRFKNGEPHWLKTLGLLGTVGVTITMLTVIFFLGPTMGYGSMYSSYNLYMHLITPFVAVIRFLLFSSEQTRLKIYDVFIGMASLAAYGIFYLINVISHNGYGTVKYDWYGFGNGGPFIGILSYIIMLAVAFLISFLLYFGEKKINSLRCKHKAIQNQ